MNSNRCLEFTQSCHLFLTIAIDFFKKNSKDPASPNLLHKSVGARSIHNQKQNLGVEWNGSGEGIHRLYHLEKGSVVGPSSDFEFSYLSHYEKICQQREDGLNSNEKHVLTSANLIAAVMPRAQP